MSNVTALLNIMIPAMRNTSVRVNVQVEATSVVHDYF